MDREEYTFTFGYDQIQNFLRIKDRLEPDEYNVVKDVYLTDEENPRYCDRASVLEMEPEAASMFRFGMKNVKIRRTRTEEELAAEEAEAAKNRITINVIMPGSGGAAGIIIP
jgi:hypothetical protein